jgi:hypothetical protein
MHTFKKLPKTSPNRKKAAARKYTLPAGSKVFRGEAPLLCGFDEIIRKNKRLGR